MDFKPQLSKMSLKLAARLGNSTDRLRSPTPQRQPRELDENCTFSPIVNPNSVKLDNRRKVDDSGLKMQRWEGLYEMVQVFKAKREELTRKFSRQEVEEEAACTFHPAISTPSTGSGIKELPARLTGWAKDKEERLQQQRDEELLKETEGCTFKPEVHELKEEGCSPLRTRKGLEKFLERQEIARKLKISKAELMDKYTGNKWTPKLTKPKSPKFRPRTETPNRKQRVHYLDLNM